MMRYDEKKLGDLIEIKHGFAFEGQFFVEEGPYILLTPGNFEEAGGFRRRDEKQKHYDGPVLQEFILKPGDLLVAMTEQGEGLLGSTAFVPDGKPCLHNQRLGLIQARPGAAVDLKFIYYLFNSRSVRTQIRASSSGTKVRHTSPSRIYSVVAAVPDLPIQRRIASILEAYDGLIEVNRRRIALLEETARRLFEEWFVRFRFPGHDNHPIAGTSGGPLPKGWRREELGALCTEIRDSVSPADVEGDTPYVGLEHIPRRSITLDAWGRADEVTSTKLRFRTADVLFGKIRPYFHKVVFAPFDGVSSSDAIVIRSRTRDLTGLALSVVSSDRFVAHAVATSNGTKMPRANWGVLAHYPVPIAPDEVMKPFNEAVVTRAELAASLNRANVRLAASRDLLLPRLMSGELSVSAAERELEAVA